MLMPFPAEPQALRHAIERGEQPDRLAAELARPFRRPALYGHSGGSLDC
jgi:hypothetical protein